MKNGIRRYGVEFHFKKDQYFLVDRFMFNPSIFEQHEGETIEYMIPQSGDSFENKSFDYALLIDHEKGFMEKHDRYMIVLDDIFIEQLEENEA